MLDNPQLQALLARVALKDRAAFRQLYELAAAHLFGVALRILVNRSAAEDALQDAFVQIWQNAGTFQASQAQPATWMTSIVRYRALDQLRKSGRDVPIEEVPAAAELVTQPVEPADPALARCLAALGVESRACVTLAFVDGYSHDELAQRVKKPLGTVKSLIRRGLQQLKECLGQ